MKIIATILLLTLSISASASWRIKQDNHTQEWFVINGSDAEPSTIWIKSATKRTAEKLAKKLNKAENSFWDDGSDYCANPLNEC